MARNNKNFLKDFTTAIAVGLTLAHNNIKQVLARLYVKSSNTETELPLIYNGDFPHIEPQAYGQYLDLLGYMFMIPRLVAETDQDYRERIMFYLTRSSTKEGLIRAVRFLFESILNSTAEIVLKEGFNDALDLTTTSLESPLRDPSGTLLYSVIIYVKPSATVHVPVLTSIFRQPTLKAILEDFAAAGIKILKVIVEEPGAGGVKGVVYAH